MFTVVSNVVAFTAGRRKLPPGKLGVAVAPLQRSGVLRPYGTTGVLTPAIPAALHFGSAQPGLTPGAPLTPRSRTIGAFLPVEQRPSAPR